MMPETNMTEDYKRLLEQLEQTQRELNVYREKSPLVGVRWYGEGSFGIKFANMIQGQSHKILHGYGDKVVIDLSTWTMIKSKPREELAHGILVRDDMVINELNVPGKVAPIAADDKNENSFTDAEIITILSSTFPKFKAVVKTFTSHWAAEHFLKVAKATNCGDMAKITLLKDRKLYLLTQYRVQLMHKHELNLTCEQHGVDFINMSREEKIQRVTDIEYNKNKVEDSW